MLFVVYFIHHDISKKNFKRNRKLGFIIACLVIIPGAALEITNKYAAMMTDISFFIVVTYLFSVGISFMSHKFVPRKKYHNVSASIRIGIHIGIVNFLAYLSLLTSLRTGPLSLISPMMAISLVVVVVLGKVLYHEELSVKQISLILLALVGTVLLRI